MLFEDRTVPITPNREIVDDFAGESDYHVYKVTP